MNKLTRELVLNEMGIKIGQGFNADGLEDEFRFDADMNIQHRDIDGVWIYGGWVLTEFLDRHIVPSPRTILTVSEDVILRSIPECYKYIYMNNYGSMFLSKEARGGSSIDFPFTNLFHFIKAGMSFEIADLLEKP